MQFCRRVRPGHPQTDREPKAEQGSVGARRVAFADFDRLMADAAERRARARVPVLMASAISELETDIFGSPSRQIVYTIWGNSQVPNAVRLHCRDC
jgi:hypothetical protein